MEIPTNLHHLNLNKIPNFKKMDLDILVNET